MTYDRSILGYHSRKIVKNLLEMARLKKGMTVLDYGCEEQMLKKHIPKGVQYIGYDIKPEYTDIHDYTKVRPDVVIMSNILEHIPLEETREIFQNFKTMGVKRLVISYPMDNWISQLLTPFLTRNAPMVWLIHIAEPKRIAEELFKAFGEPIKARFINYTQIMGVYKL